MDEYSRLLESLLRRLPREALSMTADLAAFLLAYSGQQFAEKQEEPPAESAGDDAPFR